MRIVSCVSFVSVVRGRRTAFPAAGQAGAHRGAVPARRADRHRGARHRAQDGRVARLGVVVENKPGALDRDRRARRDGRGARRAHAALHDRDPRAAAAPLQQAAVGRVPRLHADRHRHARRDGAHRAYLRAVQHRAGAGRLREGESRQAELCVVRRRHHLAPQRRELQAPRRHRDGARALQGQRRRDEGPPHRRACSCSSTARPTGIANAQHRQGQADRLGRGNAQRRRCPTCRPCARRATTSACGATCGSGDPAA